MKEKNRDQGDSQSGRANGAKCLSLTDIELGLLIESEPPDEEPLLLFTIDCPWTASFNKARCLFRFVLSVFMLAAVIREEGTMQAMRKVEGVVIGSSIRSRRRSLREEFRLQKIKLQCRPNQGYLGKGLAISIASIVCMH